MDKESVVYVIQEPGPGRDFSSAQRYGRVEFLLSRDDKPSFTPGPVLQKLRRVMHRIQPGSYITWAGGDPMAPVLAGIVLRELNMVDVKFLRWERERNENRVRTGRGYYVPAEFTTKM